VIVNLQRKIRLDAKAFRAFVEAAATAVEETEGGTFSVAFVSDRRMRELNQFFRGKDATTDVLSFPYEGEEFGGKKEETPEGVTLTEEGTPEGVTLTENATPEGVTLAYLGDIVISAEQAARQAEENGLSLEVEIKQLILHGLLHLCGYDHETDDGEMNARELELRERLNIG
jgi:probable rRNA maturation factor